MMLNREPIQEMINGEIYLLAPSAHPNHGRVIDSLVECFRKTARIKGCSAQSDNLDMYFEEGKNYVVPDFSILCDKENITANGYNGVPRLVVEVLSPSTVKKDKTVKKDLYERVGIPEYWMVDYKSQSIEKYVLINGKYKLIDILLAKNDQDESTDDLIWCEHLPEHKVMVKELFEDCF